MNRTSLIRLGGLAAMVCSVIFAVNGSLVDPEGVSSLRWSTLLFLLSVMAVIAALHLLQRERERYGNGGALVSATAFVGVALTVAGYVLVDFIIFLEGLGSTLFLVGLLVATIGIVGLAIVALVVGVLPRWGVAALICGNPLFGFFIIYFFLYGGNFALGSALDCGGLCCVPCSRTKD
jgi:hypothetical protein